MTATTKNTNEMNNSFSIRLVGMLVYFGGGIYRGVKRMMRGKCGKKLQVLFTCLALFCLGAVFYICGALEHDQLSLISAIALAVPSMAGFALFCDFAGAFRPYRYLKKQGIRQARQRRIVAIPLANNDETVCLQKIA